MKTENSIFALALVPLLLLQIYLIGASLIA